MTKKYIDFMKEISREELFEGLLGHGLFSDKLPPVFTSEAFYSYCQQEEKRIKSKRSKKSNGLVFEKRPTDYIRYDSYRNTDTTRRIGIPNPFLYFNLCVFLRGHWHELLDFFEQKTKNESYKVSQIHIQKRKKTDSLFEMKLHYSDRDYRHQGVIRSLPSTNLFMVKADISSCYPSIYSHALSWAILGKQNAKQLKGTAGIFGNEIDEISRKLKNDETNGLLIGPHTSSLLSEIILCAVDSELNQKYDYIRNIDDYCAYVKSEEEARNFIRDLEKALRGFELSINTKKTIIKRLPQPINEGWVSELLEFDILKSGSRNSERIFTLKELQLFIDKAIVLAKESNNLAVYSYAIKIISKYKLKKEALTYYVSVLHHLVYLHPYLVYWIEDCLFDKFKLSKNIIQMFAKDVYANGLASEAYQSCSFAIYWAVKYGVSLDRDYASDSVKSDDCIFMTMALIMSKYNNDRKSLKVLKAKALALSNSPDNFSYWLFIYETLSQKELKNDFAAIKKKRISFIMNKYLHAKN